MSDGRDIFTRLHSIVISVEGIETSTLREYLDTCVQFEGAPSDSGFRINFKIDSLLPPLQIAEGLVINGTGGS